MPLLRLAAFMAIVVVGGCAFWGKALTPEERAGATAGDAAPLYFSGETPATSVSQPLGTVSGFSCGIGTLFGTTGPDEAKAVNALRASAKARNATAIVNARCDRTSMFAQYQMTADTTQHAPCWPGFMCTGEAMR